MVTITMVILPGDMKEHGNQGSGIFFLSETAKFGVPVCPTTRVKKNLKKKTIFLNSECLSIWTIFMCPMHIGHSVCYIKDIVPCPVDKT